MEKLISRFVEYLDNNLGMDEERKILVEYGMLMSVHIITKTALIFATAIIFKIQKETLVSFLAIAVLRTFMGGLHLKTYWGCLVTHMILVFMPIIIDKHVENCLIFRCTVLLFMLYSVIMYVPSDTEYRPIVSKREIKKFRVVSYILCIISVILVNDINNMYSGIITMNILCVSLALNPVAYRIFNVKYGDID